MGFDPDKYLAKKTAPPDEQGFNPDVYLSSGATTSVASPEIQERVRAGGYPVAALRQGAHGVLGGFYDEINAGLETAGGLLGDYPAARQKYRDLLEETKKQYPKTSLVSNLAGSVAGLGKFSNSAKGAALASGLAGLGESKADLTKGEYGAGAADALLSAGVGLLGYGAGKGLEKVVQGARPAANWMAEKATGATRTLAKKFKKGTGQELLDRGLIKFGDTATKVGERAQGAMSSAQEGLSSALTKLDDAGVRIDTDDIIGSVDKRISELDKLAGTKPAARQLEKIKEDLVAAMGSGPQLPSTVEAQKRSFKGAFKTLDQDRNTATKEAYRGLMDATESAAQKYDPAVAKAFKTEKESYGLLKPVVKAGEEATQTAKQRLMGGLLDTTALGAGALTGDSNSERASHGLATAAAMRLLRNRGASSSAVTLNQLAKIIEKTPSVIKELPPEIIKRLAPAMGQAVVPERK